jgi:hypothetical protein
MKKLYYLTNENITWIKENYTTIGAIECAKYLNFPVWFLHKTARKLNLKVGFEKIQHDATKRGLTRVQSLMKLRHENLKTIIVDSQQKAYLLGLLWGDGYLNYHGNVCYPFLTLIKKDFEDILSLMNCFGEWKIRSRRRLLTHHQEIMEAYLIDACFGLFLDINDFKYKSIMSPTKILQSIPDEYKSYWWRGYSDADGCFYMREPPDSIYQFSFAGTYEQDWSELEKLFIKLNIHYTIQRTQRKNENKYSHIRITSKNEIKKWGDYLYNRVYDHIGLKRKYDKYCLIRERCNST